jgi:hypothetical protein
MASELSSQPGQTGVTSIQIAAYLGHKNNDITRRVFAPFLSEDSSKVAKPLSGIEFVSSVFSVETKGSEGESQTP